MRILLIDDTRTVHAFVKGLVSKSPDPIEIIDAWNGKEGLDALAISSKDKPFDVILLDWEMPIMDGPTTLEQLKKMGCTIPVVMMTTKDSPDDIVRMLAAGASEYLMKPFTWEILIEKIKSVVPGGNTRAVA